MKKERNGDVFLRREIKSLVGVLESFHMNIGERSMQISSGNMDWMDRRFLKLAWEDLMSVRSMMEKTNSAIDRMERSIRDQHSLDTNPDPAEVDR